MTPRDRARVLGCDIDRLDMDETVRRCAEIIESGGPVQHVVVNVAKVVALRDDAGCARSSSAASSSTSTGSRSCGPRASSATPCRSASPGST